MPSRRTPEPFAAQIGARIRQLRKEKKMSLHALARASGLSRGHLSDVEQGKVVMNIGTLGQLARALETPPFIICLVPKDDPEVSVVDHVFVEGDPDLAGAAKRIRAAVLERDEAKGRVPDE